ncbi:hypothetical protein [Janibacter anophelis]|uniref:hypothetical protein n=1 Tax=Janibacter anophelis TaxID=319054 RepID=UPI0008325A70|nr:hypothetical protein [Janibacter anophelis]
MATDEDFFDDNVGSAPMLIVQTGEREAVVYAEGDVPGWIPIGQQAWEHIRPLLDLAGGTSASSGSARYFEACPEDFAVWDQLKHHTRPDGYKYATAWGKDGKFATNMGIREVDPSQVVGQTSVDPASLAIMAAIACLQASIDRLTDMVKDLSVEVGELKAFLHGEQQGQILAMVETIDTEVYESYLRTGAVSQTDWERIAHAEQLFKAQHRQLLIELSDVQKTLAFRTAPAAKQALRMDLRRVTTLVALEAYLLRSFSRWVTLMLTVKQQRGGASSLDVEQIRRRVDEYRVAAHRSITAIRDTDTHMRGRPWSQLLIKEGIPLGVLNDRSTRRDAVAHRRALQKAIGDTPALDDVPLPKLRLAAPVPQAAA